ncbi:unnamed protein product [Durusdinium trenchii]|uniref:RRM domain-containing protein n=1 Tax=Durusdinium trenchii TaxID=1381693 RepID=A0ABP0KLN7_9DINO
MQILERWRDRKEAFAEWKQTLLEMRNHIFQENDDEDGSDLESFLGQDQHYFGSLSPDIRNLTVQTLLGLDSKQVFKRLTVVQKERIMRVLSRGIQLGKTLLPLGDEIKVKDVNVDRIRSIFTKHQTEQLSRLAEKFSEGRVQRAQETDPGEFDMLESKETEDLDDSMSAAAEAETPKEEKLLGKALRTVYITGLAESQRLISRDDLKEALRPIAEVDGARVGAQDALVRFATTEQAKKALAVLQRRELCVRHAVLAGQMAPSDHLSEEALALAGGRPVETDRTETMKALQSTQVAQCSQSNKAGMLPAVLLFMAKCFLQLVLVLRQSRSQTNQQEGLCDVRRCPLRPHLKVIRALFNATLPKHAFVYIVWLLDIYILGPTESTSH